MKKYLMKERHIPLDDSYDVIVVGGGPSGCLAAIAAAGEGANTLLVESTGALGGMGTSGGVTAWQYFSDGIRFLYSNTVKSIFDSCKAGMDHIPDDKIHGYTPLDPELLKRIYDDHVVDSGADVLFFTLLSAVEGEDGNVSEIILANKSGLQAYKASVYIDCTGDADLAVWAGADFEQGDINNETQPATLCFILSNVDLYGYLNGPPIKGIKNENPTSKMLDSGKYPHINDGHVCNYLIGPGTIGFNAGHMWDIDPTKPETLTQGMMTGRKIAAEFCQGLRKFHPTGFGNAFLSSTATLMGVRETRRIIGDYVLNIEDYRVRRKFPDEIARNSNKIDVHISKEENNLDIQERERIFQERTETYEKGESYGIPYRCLTPAGLKNILVAGRSISTDRWVQGSTRIMGPCMAFGEAAGVAAAIAAKNGKDIHNVDTDILRKKLKNNGVYLP